MPCLPSSVDRSNGTRARSRDGRSVTARFVRSARGNASIELAFILPFLVLLATGTYDLGRGFMEKLRLNGAAKAGTQYALQLGHTTQDTAGIIQKVREDADDTENLVTVTPRYYCGCLDGSEITCGSVCTGGEMPLQYIEVDASRSIDLIFDLPFVPDPFTIQGHAELRLR